MPMVKLQSAVLAVAIVLLAGCASAVTYDKSGNVLEPASSTPYPLKMKDMDLAGVAIRVKKIAFISVQVYAVGLYVKPSSAGKVLAEFKGKAMVDLQKEAKIYSAIVKDNSMDKTLRLVMVRTVTGAQMGDAISEAVELRMGKNPGEAAQSAFKAFKGFFNMPQLKTGTEISFSWIEGGRLTVIIDGKSVGTIKSVPVATALFDVFLGDQAVVERKDLIEHFPNILAQ